MNPINLPNQPPEEKPIWKVKDVANFFSVNPSSVYRWIEDGKIKPEQIHRTPGGQLRFKPSDFQSQQQENNHA